MAKSTRSAPRFCSQCGSPLVWRHAENRLRAACPACDVIVYEHLKVGAAALAQRGSEIVLIRRATEPFAGYWGLPAGYVEDDEHPEHAAVRECREETGLEIAVDRLFGVYYFDDDPRGNGILIVYQATVVGGALSGGVEGDTAFFSPHALPDHIAGAGHDRALRDWSRATHEVAAAGPMRFCPKCGYRLSERHIFGRDRHICDACGFIFFRDPKIAAGALVEQEGRVLLARRSVNPAKGKWYVPGGFVEIDESIEEAAIREIREETGLEIALDSLLGVYSFGNPQRGFNHLILYRAHPVGGTLMAGDDADAAAFFGPDELPSEIAFSTSRDALDKWVAEQARKRK